MKTGALHTGQRFPKKEEPVTAIAFLKWVDINYLQMFVSKRNMWIEQKSIFPQKSYTAEELWVIYQEQLTLNHQ